MLSPERARASRNNVPTLTLIVRWDGAQRKYIALDTCGSLLCTSSDKDEVLCIAMREATSISRAGVQILVMSQDRDGTLHHECTAEPDWG